MTVLKFLSPTKQSEHRQNWSNQELAEFYRVVDVLARAGVAVEAEGGVSDEGEPWFVFARSETGDIVAHFARIDGAFIAISSFNQRVYKAKDLKEILSQMLDKHPFLLPRKTGGKVFLHPAAALTAFIAAALILSIDGTREVSIVEVLASLKDENSETNNFARPSDLRSELGRLITTELSAGGYAAAIFGVALFSSQMEEVKQAIAFQDDFGSLEFDEPEIGDGAVVAGDEEHGHYLSGSQGIESGMVQVNFGRNEDLDVDSIDHLVSSIADASQNEKTKLEIGDISKIVLDAFSDEGRELPFPRDMVGTVKFDIFPYEQENFSGSSDAIVKDGPLSIHAEENAGEIKFSALAEAIYGAFQKAFYEGIENGLLAKSSLSFAVGKTGEFVIVSLDKAEFASATDAYPVQGEHNLFAIAPSAFSDSGALVSESAEGSLPVEKQTNTLHTQTISDLPILGHDLTSLGEEDVQLSDGIDVVFFDGGEYKATGFELGKDLLWFFLEPLDLASVQSNIVNGSDLVLSFGDIGTLTLAGVLENTEPLDFV